jgi:sugar O-acyltransferase (sialic acid O-acetyltransferase NeuD family)
MPDAIRHTIGKRTCNAESWPMRSQPLLVIGAGSFAPEVASVAADAGFEIVALVDDRIGDDDKGRRDDYEVISLSTAARLAGCVAVCGVGAPDRYPIIVRATAAGIVWTTVVHPAAHAARSARLGAGTIVFPGAILAHGVSAGEHTLINRGSLIGHHARLGHMVTLGPGANVASRVDIGDRARIGMGVLVVESTTIGHDAAIAAGAVVRKSVPSGTMIAGSAARMVARASDT